MIKARKGLSTFSVLIILVTVIASFRSVFVRAEKHDLRQNENVAQETQATFRVTVDGKVEPVRLTGPDLETSILSQPIPQVWLIFTKSDESQKAPSSSDKERK